MPDGQRPDWSRMTRLHILRPLPSKALSYISLEQADSCCTPPAERPSPLTDDVTPLRQLTQCSSWYPVNCPTHLLLTHVRLTGAGATGSPAAGGSALWGQSGSFAQLPRLLDGSPVVLAIR